MKNFRLEVPEGRTDNCELCPFYTSNDWGKSKRCMSMVSRK